jgi:hypothetical protein
VGHEDSSKDLKFIQDVALRVLKLFDLTRTVWIGLDRVDKCGGRASSYQRRMLVRALVYLIEKSKVKVRILAVVNEYDWRVQDEVDELGQTDRLSIRT